MRESKHFVINKLFGILIFAFAVRLIRQGQAAAPTTYFYIVSDK